MGPQAGGKRTGPLPLDPGDPLVLRYWSHEHDRLKLLENIRQEIAATGWRMRADSGWHDWDLEIYSNRYVRICLKTVTEHHHGSGLLTKVRLSMGMSNLSLILMGASLLLTGHLLYYLWPFSRPAILIPVVWWALFQINRRRVGRPVLGLVDGAAERGGFWPVK